MGFLKTLQAQGRISESALRNLESFASLILEWNQRINLTGFKERAQVEEFLIGDSLLALQFLPVSSREILDFGSGAGIPGLVWAMCDPTAKVTSLESRQKKVAFQKEVLRELRLEAEVLWGRFPETVVSRHFDLVVSRAIRFSPDLWANAEKLLNPRGSLVRFSKPGQSLEGWKTYQLSSESTLLVSG
jgi:16S rRNA (guanine527-N7)-methyltransferase